jgi:hypothetical protein
MWASAIVLSRQNELPDGVPVLIPCWDMCNDKGNGAESYFVQENGNIVAETRTDIKSGQEIFINYGDRPCSRLLALQGYFNKEHITEMVIQVTLKDFEIPSDDIDKLRAMLFQKKQISSQPMTLSPDGSVSPSLMWAARIACLDRDSAAFLLRNPTVERINPANERSAMSLLDQFLSRLHRDAVSAQQRIDSTVKTESVSLKRINLALSLAQVEQSIIERIRPHLIYKN